jgi:hypothetical protein
MSSRDFRKLSSCAAMLTCGDIIAVITFSLSDGFLARIKYECDSCVGHRLVNGSLLGHSISE